MYKGALLGCGPRSQGHADAYRLTKRGRLAAICSDMPDRLNAFGDKYGISSRYADLATMLQKEKPDVLHIVTHPTVRLDLLRLADDHGVPLVIVEKPIAIGGDDYKAIAKLAATMRTKVCVNHQLHFHPRSLDLQRYVTEGRIGKVRLLDASTRLNVSAQGTHALELMNALAGGLKAESVVAHVAGNKNMTLGSYSPGPDQIIAAVSYAGGVTGHLLCGPISPKLVEMPDHMHKRVAVYGEKGFVHWTMHGWQRTKADGTVESGTHDYFEQDLLGQAGLTEAAFDWLDDARKIHPTNLAASLDQFNMVLAMYQSALTGQRVALPFNPPDDLFARLQARFA